MSGPRLSIIPARAATDRALKPRDLQVLCVLGRHTDDLGWCRKSQVKMADEMGCARSTVFEAIERLVKAGYLERHIQEEESGRDSPHVYRVILDPVHPAVDRVKDADSAPSDPCRQAGTPAGISAPPAGPEPAPPAGSGPAPKNDPFRTTDSERSERETRKSEREEGQTGEAAQDGQRDDPRKFEPRVKRLAAACSWPGWAKSDTAWSVAGFAKLTDEERAAAEQHGPAYVAHCGKKALSIGNYFRGRKWLDLPADVLSPPPKPEFSVVPPFGPDWMAGRFVKLFAGPDRPAHAGMLTAFERAQVAQGLADEADLLRQKQARTGFTAVTVMDDLAARYRGVVADVVMRRLAGMMEAVPVGCAVFEDWRAEHARRGWPWIPDPGQQPVVFFPRGGPAGLSAFEAAVNEGQGDDGGEREAAE